MITKFMTEISVRLNPFTISAKPARLLLTLLPANIRANGTTVNTTLVPRGSTEPSFLHIKFKDGKVMRFNCEKASIKSVVEELDRHSRQLQKAADLTE